tara:strand:+ start:3659 stop:4279 length:621 start_codon:yes stop_codon:yes gene_type:complete
MCVFAAPVAAGAAKAAAVPLISKAGLFGLGAKASNLFLAQLGLAAVTSGMQMAQANRIASYQGQAAVRAAESANKAFAIQQEGLASRLREERQKSAQERQEVGKKRLQAEGAIRASERTGLTIDLLLADADRQAANWQDALTQTMQSATQQYGRDVKGLEAQRDGRTNQAIDTRNQAMANQRGLLDVIAQTASTGLSSYANLYQKA